MTNNLVASPTEMAGTTGLDTAKDHANGNPLEQTHDFFFYGTLLVPAILIRVLGHDCSKLTFQDALLPNYTRHCIKGEDYPAVINRDQTAELVPRESVLLPEDFFTRGTVVRGLSYADVHALDIFEGTQYSRVKLPVQTLSPPEDQHHLPKALLDPESREEMNQHEAVQAAKHLASGTDGGKDKQIGTVSVWVYVWSESLDLLEPSIWSFTDFLKEKAHVWTGMETTEFDEVERRRALDSMPGYKQGPATCPDETWMDGDESKIVGKTMEGFPEFGHSMRKFWKFDKDYVNLNHGSYGSPPVPVLEAMQKLSDEIESYPDLFMRRSWLPRLDKVRSMVAEIIGAQTDEVVMVPNATHGVNNVVTQIAWQDGDVIVVYASTYGAVSQTMKHLCDRNPGLSLEVIDVAFPCSHNSILEKTEEVFAKYNQTATPNYTGESKPTGVNSQQRVRMAVIDSIASMPGVIYPWEEIVRLCKKYGVLSMVDAAHSIGQHKVNVDSVDCDFFVSNCHKWLMSHRGGALLYVPLRNQHLIRSTFPTSAGYESTRYPSEDGREWSFTKQYQWTGTMDWRSLLTITDAIEFRRSIGGEERIMQYNHSLAVQGGRRLRKLFGTSILENTDLGRGELTAAMVNVVLPDSGPAEDLEERFKQYKYFEEKMFEGKVFAAIVWHNGKWVARFSAQVWNELSDFEYVGNVLSKICQGIKRGEHLQVEVAPTETLHDAKDLPVSDL